MEQGRQAEESNRYVHALSFYYDAMTEDLANGADEAYQAFDNLARELESGFPKIGTMKNNLELGWRRIQEEYDKFWIENCPLSFDFSPLEKGRMGYGKNYITYSTELKSHYSSKYKEISRIIYTGWDKARNYNWKNLNPNWPKGSFKNASELKQGFVKTDKVYSAPLYDPSLYSVEFSVYDKNEKILFSTVLCENGKKYVFVNPSKTVERAIDSGDVKFHIGRIFLNYGDASGFKSNYVYNLPRMSISSNDVRITNAYEKFPHETSSYSLITFQKHITNYLTMIPVASGSFSMGSNSGYPRERPVHTLEMNSFEISSTEVTQLLYSLVMEDNPSHQKEDSLPVERVSWYDAIYFCNLLSQMTGHKLCYSVDGVKNPYEWNYKIHTGQHLEGEIVCDFKADGYRLPTEAEWEYAAMEGNKNSNFRYAGSSVADDVAWTKSNAGGKTHPVASKKANALGIYDMSGNVGEWCWDWYLAGWYYYTGDSNPTGPKEGDYRIVRGGSIWDENAYCRVADRSDSNPENKYGPYGIRIVRTTK